MRSIKQLRPSPALIVALVALMAGLGGTAVAGSMITGKSIARDAITSRHVKNGSLQLSDLAPRMRSAMSKANRGPQGPAGPQGLQGKAGARGPQGQIGPQGPAGHDGWSCKDSNGNVKPECQAPSQQSEQQPVAGDTLLATVTADGKLEHGHGVKVVSHTGSGDYLVQFAANGLNRCTNVATIVGSQQGDDGSATILVSPASVTNTIRVQTFVDKDRPTATDKPFNLAVFCQ
jgi:hypothetical protein